MKRFYCTEDGIKQDKHGRYVLIEEVEPLLAELNLLRSERQRYVGDEARDAARYRHLRVCADREFVNFHDGAGNYHSGCAEELDKASDNSRQTISGGKA